MVHDGLRFGKFGQEEVGGKKAGGGEPSQSLDDGARDGRTGEGGAGYGIDFRIAGSPESEPVMAFPKIGVFLDRAHVVRGVGRRKEPGLHHLSGEIEGQGDIARAGISLEMIAGG